MVTACSWDKPAENPGPGTNTGFHGGSSPANCHPSRQELLLQSLHSGHSVLEKLALLCAFSCRLLCADRGAKSVAGQTESALAKTGGTDSGCRPASRRRDGRGDRGSHDG